MTTATDPDPGCLDDNQLSELVEGRLPPATRAAALEHLDTCPSCRGLVAAAAPDHATQPEADDDDAPLRRGAALDRYLILDVLGAGGMGIVYLAYDPELDRRVALKVLRAPEPAGPGRRSSVLAEAQAMARLVHPNVVAVHDVGMVDARVFLVMDHVDGAPLSLWLRASERAWQAIVAVFIQAGQGLAAAHAAGLVHRDFKPENVLVDGDGRVLVGDFGLARAQSELARADASGRLAGTPAYMAPEQLLGEEVDARADVFAFSVALYEALYRQHPYGGRTIIALGPLAEAPRGARVPPWLRAIVVRGLDPDPATRTPSMAALLAALARDPARRRRSFGLAAAAIATVAAAVMIGAAMRPAERPCSGAATLLAGVWDEPARAAIRGAFAATGAPWADDTWRTVERGLDEYSGAWVTMREEACAATRIRGEQSEPILDLRLRCLDQRLEGLRQLTRLFARADAETALGAARGVHSSPRLQACADVPWLTERVPPPEDPGLRAQVDAARGELARIDALHASGRYREGERAAAALVEVARGLAYKPLIAEALKTWSLLLDRTGEYATASAAMTQALHAAEAGRDRRLAAYALIELVWLDGHQQSHHEAALATGRHAAALLEGLGGDDELQALLVSNESAVLGDLSRYVEAEATAREALRLREAVYGPEHFKVAISINNLAATLAWMGRHDESRVLQERALAMYTRIVGPHHPQTLHTLINVASALAKEGRLFEAEAMAERARVGLIAAHGPEHAAVAAAENILGLIALDQGRPTVAGAHFERAIAIGTVTRGDDHPTIAHYTCALAEAIAGAGDHAAAIPRYNQAIERYARIGDPVQGARCRTALARSLLADGEVTRARVTLEEVLAVQEAQEPDPIVVARARVVLASALLEPPAALERARGLASLALAAAAQGGPSGVDVEREARAVLGDPRLR